MKSKITCLTITALLALTTVAQADFSNGFEGTEYPGEIETYDWSGEIQQVSSGTGGITSATDTHHAVTAAAQTWWGNDGGYNALWQGGFTTSIDLYLDTTMTTAPFSWTSGIANNLGSELYGGFFTFSGLINDGTDYYEISVSNADGLVPLDADPFAITSGSGWYTFEHSFEQTGSTLSVRMSILGDSGLPLYDWTFAGTHSISDIGGSSTAVFYGSDTDFAIDNTSMTTAVVPVPGALLLAGFGLSCAGLHLRKRRS